MTALAAVYVLALVIGNMGITGVGGGILAAAVVWIGVGAMTSLNAALYSEVHKGVWMLNAAYNSSCSWPQASSTPPGRRCRFVGS